MSDFFLVPPAFYAIITALCLPFVPKLLRYILVIAVPIFMLDMVWQLPREVGSTLMHLPIAGFDLSLLTIHPFSHIFASVFCLTLAAGGLFALNQDRKMELAAAFLYGGSSIGVVFAGDLISLFIYWELMAIGSTIIIVSNGTQAARSAGIRYGLMHFLGGVFVLSGISALSVSGHSLSIGLLAVDLKTMLDVSQYTLDTTGRVLLLTGVLVNAAAPPFSAWLADSYPESSPSGMVFLSAFTTKTAVFVLLTIFAGTEILLYLGLFMVFYGIIYALLENDMRRILAYSIVNQVGFMVTGIGIGTSMALAGTATHAFCHIIYKAVLLMSAGSVLYMTGKRKCSELGGLYRTMPVTLVCGVIGALAISAFPFTSGFVSKSLISDGAAQEGLMLVWYLLAAASAGVFLHAGIKFPWFVFFQKDSGLRPTDPPRNMQIAMILFAILCIYPALFPNQLYALLPYAVEYAPYTAEHVISQLQLLLFAGLAFFVLLPMLKRTDTISLDIDWLYRVFLKHILKLVDRFVFFCKDLLRDIILAFYRKLQQMIDGVLFSTFGMEVRRLSIGMTVLWAVLLLGLFQLVYFLN